MKLLNELYDKSCKPKYERYTKISNKITLIDNFFENFELAKYFFTNTDKWKCTSYQNYAKQGYESLFPSWIGKSLMEKFILDNKIDDDIGSYDVKCNFFYDTSDKMWALSNSNYFPHIDSVQYHDILQYICLVNLNNIPVSTKFYSYKNKEYCSPEKYAEWKEYTKGIKEELFDFYNKEDITRNEFKTFLDQKKNLDVKLIREVYYKPNQAIFYPANLFHSPNVTKKFTENNPRFSLRIIFDVKVNLKNQLNYS